jgi:hypothetical protein
MHASASLSVSNYTARFDSRGLALTRPLRRRLARTKSRRHPGLSSQSFESVAGPVAPVLVIVPRCRRRKGLRVACVAVLANRLCDISPGRMLTLKNPDGRFTLCSSCHPTARPPTPNQDGAISTMTSTVVCYETDETAADCLSSKARRWHQRSSLTKNDGGADGRALFP